MRNRKSRKRFDWWLQKKIVLCFRVCFVELQGSVCVWFLWQFLRYDPHFNWRLCRFSVGSGEHNSILNCLPPKRQLFRWLGEPFSQAQPNHGRGTSEFIPTPNDSSCEKSGTSWTPVRAESAPESSPSVIKPGNDQFISSKWALRENGAHSVYWFTPPPVGSAGGGWGPPLAM